MECGICFEPFDAARRRPKVLPCGHTACLACLEGLRVRRCPECRLVFAHAAGDLPDNIAMMRQPRMWCSDCKTLAKSDCIEEHNLRNAKAALKDEVVQLQVRAAQLAGKLPEALRQDGDRCPEQALRVLQLARQPGTTFDLDLTVRGQDGEAVGACWTNPPATPAGQQGAAEDVHYVQSVATDVLVLALAKKGAWQQRGGKRKRGGEAELQEGRADGEATPTPDLPVMEELKLELRPTAQRKSDLLVAVRQHRVRALTKVCCEEDPVWSLQLLRLAAPHVEELHVAAVHGLHLLEVLDMPELRRLEVHGPRHGLSHGQSAFPAELPPLPAHHAGLRWLSVAWLPRGTTFGLIRAHAGTLEELGLHLGLCGQGEWPVRCDDLPAALARCGLARLRRLVVERIVVHDSNRCRAQLRALRGALSGVQVQCSLCDSVHLNF